MKYYYAKDELYPFYYISREKIDVTDLGVELPDELVELYNFRQKEFMRIYDKINSKIRGNR